MFSIFSIAFLRFPNICASGMLAKCTFFCGTPRTAADFRVSLTLVFGSPPSSPFVRTRRKTLSPALMCFAIEPAQPRATSSGCAETAKTLNVIGLVFYNLP